MSTARRVLRALGAGLGFTLLLVGVPLALVAAVGWPLPHSWPSLRQIGVLLSTSGIPDIVLIDALACLCWLAWIDLAIATAVEVVAALQGRRAARHTVLAPWQPFVAYVVTAIVIALSTGSRSPHNDGQLRPAGLSGAAGVRPVAALQHPEGVSATATAITAEAASASPSAEPSDEYTVRGGDTLWDISGDRLGNPRRWPQVWDLNRERAEPRNRSFRDPNLILPGWKLRLPPATAAAPKATRAPNPVAKSGSSAPPKAPPAVVSPRLSSPTAPAGPGVVVPSQRPAAGAPPTGASAPVRGSPPSPAAPRAPASTGTVRLPEGGLIGLGLAASIAGLVGLARLHERRRRRIGSPLPGAVEALTTETVRRCRRPAAELAILDEEEEDGDTAEPSASPATDYRPAERAVPVGQLRVGPSPDGSGESLVDVESLSGLTLTGPGADAALRALLVSALAQPQRSTDVVVTAATTSLIADLDAVPGVEVAGDMPDALATLEAEIVRRGAALSAAAVSDWRETLDGPDPMSALVAVLDGSAVAGPDRPRLQAIVTLGRRLGLTVIVRNIADGPDALYVGEDGHLADDDGGVLDGLVQLYTLSAGEAAELVSVIAASRGVAIPDPTPLPPTPPADRQDLEPARALPAGELARSVRPVQLFVFGPPRVEVLGDEVSTGLRRRARELLCLLIAHPRGLRVEEVVDLLWPEDEADWDRCKDILAVNVSSVRVRMRELTGRREADFVRLVADRYVLDATLVDSDLWRFEAALATSTAAASSVAKRESLERVVEVATGEPFAGAPYEWVEPIRENLRRRAVDALSKLADERESSGDLAGAVAVLEQAQRVDPLCEEVYRRLMRVQQHAGRPDAAGRAYRELERRLVAIGAVPEAATEALLSIGSEIAGKAEDGETRQSAAVANDADSSDDDDVLSAMAMRRVVTRRNQVNGATRDLPRNPGRVPQQDDLSIVDEGTPR